MGEFGKPIMLAVTPSIYPELEVKIKGAFLNVNLPVFRSVRDVAETLSRLYQYKLGRNREL